MQKGLCRSVVHDLKIESEFAGSFEKSGGEGCLGWFKIDTPSGGYNQGLALLINREDSDG